MPWKMDTILTALTPMRRFTGGILLHRIRKNSTVPIKDSALLLLEDCWYAQYEDVSEAVSQDTEELLDQVQNCVEDMDRELGETFSYMRRMGLYDVDWSGENGSRSGSFNH